jgi:hypothetical protein
MVSPMPSIVRWSVFWALVAPSAALATDMPPIELLFVPPILVAVVVTLVGWLLLGRMKVGTARSFSRMLLLVLLWTPVPMGTSCSLVVLPSVIVWWFLPNADSGARVTAAIAIGVVAVLGAAVLVVRSGWRLYTSVPRR